MLRLSPNKNYFSGITFVILIVALLTACSAEKRHYMKGYHITKRHKAVSKNEQVTKTEVKEEKNNSLVASVKNDLTELKNELLPKRTTIFDSVPKKQECDSIFFRTGGDKIAGKLVEINTNEVKYRKCSNPDGPLFIVKKSDVVKVKYANGTEEIITTNGQQFDNYKSPEDKKRAEEKRNKKIEEARNSGERKFLYTALFSVISAGLAFIALLTGSAAGVVFYFLLAAAALALAIFTLSKMKKNKGMYKGQGLAITGLIIGGVELIIFLFLLLIVIALM